MSDEISALTGDTETSSEENKTAEDVLADDVEDVEDQTSDDDKKEETSEDVTSDDEEEEESTEEKEGDPEDEEPDDKDLNEDEDEEEDDDFDDSEITRPSWQEIKEKHPELAKNKDFREMFHSERQYRELFPTVKEAKEAATASEAFNVLADDIQDGNLKNVFTNIEEESLDKVVENFLPDLYEHNPKLYGKATKPVIINLLHNIHGRAVREGDDNLRKSVRNLSKVLTGKFDLPAKTEESPEIREERESLKQERERLFKQDEGKFVTSLDEAVDRRLTKLITDLVGQPEDLTEFSRNAVIEKTYRDVMRTMREDEGLKRRLMSLHRQAGRAGFTKEFKSRMVATYLERARRLVGNAKDKHLRAALGKDTSPKGKNGKAKKKVVTTEDVKTRSARGVRSIKDIDTSKTSPEDFLHDRNVHLKE